jgi:hypothetical protein
MAMNSVLEPFDHGLDVLEALLELIQALPILVLRLRVPEEAQPLADALSPAHPARLGGAGRGRLRARSAAVIWRTTSDPLRICASTSASFWRRRSCARSCVLFIV